MLVKTIRSLFYYGVGVTVLLACSNPEPTTGTNNDQAVTSEKLVTEIKGELLPVLNFYEVSMQDDGQTFGEYAGGTFNIILNDNIYSAVWISDNNDEDSEEIKVITEKTPGETYEFQTSSGTYTITMLNKDGIWLMTNSNNDHKGYLCDTDAAIMYESEESNRDPDDTPVQIIADMGQKWVALSKEFDRWIIFNECRYGSGGIYFEEDGSWIEFSGGGDAWSKAILEMQRTEYDQISLKLGDESGENTEDFTIRLAKDNIIIFNEGTENERGYILNSATDLVETVNEECDEEE